MLDHISVGVADLDRAARFYEATLAPLDLTRLVTRPATIGFGKAYPEFWINLRPGMPAVGPESGFHICLRRVRGRSRRQSHRSGDVSRSLATGENRRQGLSLGASVNDSDGLDLDEPFGQCERSHADERACRWFALREEW